MQRTSKIKKAIFGDISHTRRTEVVWMQQQESFLLNSDDNVGRRRMMQQVGFIRTNTNNSILGARYWDKWQREELATGNVIIKRCEDGIYRNASVKG